VPVYVGNDANVAVLAEVARGAAKGCKHAIYITVSTGVGSGIMVEGRLLLGHRGIAAEVGYTTLFYDGKADYFENFVAGPALARRARQRIEHGAESLILALSGGDLDRIDSKVVGDAALQGDGLALEIVKETGYVLGLGMVSLLHLFNPDILILGGGVTNVGELLFEPMHAAIREFTVHNNYLEQLRIEQPLLGEDVSLIGAAALVRTEGGLLPLLET
jgi:glucokinase